ncbi:dihydroxyacetone kinase family protein [Ornithinimicrobium sp. LYQ92]|uniref:dihydroxyacetone kinase family protein n=1 Tax=Serinicoccus sp. LYQ92 TaxID=3378798 RepID=UPI0038539ACD
MTHLANDPADFAAEALEGFAALHPDLVQAVPGGVIRATPPRAGHVALVLGGGSGHHPAFAGWVGPGMGHGAVCGNIFSSPSESQVLSVARAAEAGGGVLFVPINYAGDILHFGAAREALEGDEVPARLVAVTDDIASGGPAERHQRRGIAGSFLVVKVLAAAADSGMALDPLADLAVRVNDATRSLGVAFSGCTLPGADQALFSVPSGQMAVGLGIHGEPGLSHQELGTAQDVADLLVDGLTADRPISTGGAVAVLVNGLGATTPDELYLVAARVQSRLVAAGARVVAPVVGSLVTSMDMAGVSVSLLDLDEETESYWLAPAHTSSFWRAETGSSTPPVSASTSTDVDPRAASAGTDRGMRPDVTAPADPRSVAAAGWAHEALGRAVSAVEAQEAELGALDAVAGDGDHGAGMVRGARAAHQAMGAGVADGAGLGTALHRAGTAWSDVAGGTSGALWGAGLRASGDSLGDDAEPTAGQVLDAVQAFLDAVQSRGGAQLGDKTMVDALVPFVEHLRHELDRGSSLREAWSAAADAATRAAQATADHAARTGRSRTHGDASIGTPDPGAVSLALIVGSAN